MGHQPDIRCCLSFSLDNIHYAALPSQRDYHLQGAQEHDLLTVIRIDFTTTTISREWLQQCITEITSNDDVFQLQFLTGLVILRPANSKAQCNTEALELLVTWGNRWLRFIDEVEDVTKYPQTGLFIMQNESMMHVWRLYEDTANAFLSGLRRDSESSQIPLEINIPGSRFRTIAVPSRLRGQRNLDDIRCNFRITVKDMIDVETCRSSLGSCTYLELHEPAKRTAPAIQRLIDKSVHLVGISTMCPMVGSAEPVHCVDFPAPFNPRGNGYQSPSGGSSGQASAVATFEWLDFAIGTDSTVSGRLPAQANGCFSLRPTKGLIDDKGLWSAVPQFDTLCLFGRDLSQFDAFMRLWYENTSTLLDVDFSPQSIIYISDFLPTRNTQQIRIVEDFIKDLEIVTGMSTNEISLSHMWQFNPPSEAEGQSIQEYLPSEIGTSTYIYQFWQKIKCFQTTYAEKFDKMPFFPPPNGIKLWEKAAQTSFHDHERDMHRISVYRRWLWDLVLQLESRSILVVMPIGSVQPNYRDEWPNKPNNPQLMWESLLMAPILGAPEVVIPCGSIEYFSRISERHEQLPVCVSIMANPGTDLKLVEYINKFLVKAGRETKVQVGRHCFQERKTAQISLS